MSSVSYCLLLVHPESAYFNPYIQGFLLGSMLECRQFVHSFLTGHYLHQKYHSLEFYIIEIEWDA